MGLSVRNSAKLSSISGRRLAGGQQARTVEIWNEIIGIQ